MRRSIAASSLAFLALLGAVPGSAQQADEVVARFTAALGGLEAVRGIETLRKVGTYVYNGLEHPVVVIQKRDGGCREEIDGLTPWGTAVETGKVVVRAWDGETAWVGSVDGSVEAEPMPEGELPGFLLDARIEASLIASAEKGHRVQVVGPTEVEGVDAIEVMVARAEGSVESWFVDAATYLPVMRTTAIPEGEYKAAMTWYFDDFREVAGVQMPFYVLIEERLFSREYIFETIEANVAVNDEIFRQPVAAESGSGS